MIINSVRNGTTYSKPDGESALQNEQREKADQGNPQSPRDRVSLSGKGRLLQQAAYALDGLPGDHVVAPAEVIQISRNHKDKVSAILEKALQHIDIEAVGSLRISIDPDSAVGELKLEVEGTIEEEGEKEILQEILSENFAKHFRGASNADHLLYARQSLKTYAIDSHQSAVYADARYNNMMSTDWNFSVSADKDGVSYKSPLTTLTGDY